MIQEIIPKLTEIKSIPTEKDMVHESYFRATHILSHILTMVERGDSKETIMDVYYHLSN